MSIASNVLAENEKLGTARTLLREKLTANGVPYKNSDSIFTLIRRWVFTGTDIHVIFSYPNENESMSGNTGEAGATVYTYDSNDDAVYLSGVPVDITIDGVSYTVLTDNDGEAKKSFTFGEPGTTLTLSIAAGKSSVTETYTVKLFGMEEEYPEDSMFDIVKYPSDIELTFESFASDPGYTGFGLLVSKPINSASAAFLIPKGTPAINASESGIHFKCGMVQKKTSNSGWGDAICLLNSKNLSHARNTKILELGVYPGKKGVKYSNSDHVVRDVSVTTGQLTLDSKWYTFEFYFDDGYLEATIKDGSTTVFSYTGDVSSSISFDSYYPAFMIYDYGGSMIFNDVLIEPWTKEE